MRPPQAPGGSHACARPQPRGQTLSPRRRCAQLPSWDLGRREQLEMRVGGLDPLQREYDSRPPSLKLDGAGTQPVLHLNSIFQFPPLKQPTRARAVRSSRSSLRVAETGTGPEAPPAPPPGMGGLAHPLGAPCWREKDIPGAGTRGDPPTRPNTASGVGSPHLLRVWERHSLGPDPRGDAPGERGRAEGQGARTHSVLLPLGLCSWEVTPAHRGAWSTQPSCPRGEGGVRGTAVLLSHGQDTAPQDVGGRAG